MGGQYGGPVWGAGGQYGGMGVWGARALMDGLASCGPSAAHRFWWGAYVPLARPLRQGALPQPKASRFGG